MKPGDLAPPTRDLPHAAPQPARSDRLDTSSLPALLVHRAIDYAELTKMRVNLLVLFVTGVGFFLGSGESSMDYLLLVECLLGTALLGAGASALNQYIERAQDALMQRTEARPLPVGRIRPFEALAIGIFLGVSGVLCLALLVGPLASLVGAASFLVYVIVYTPLKRHTPHALFVGAVPGALPPVIGWAAARGELGPEAWAIFAILFVWQIPHFLAIAWLYRDDYLAGDFPTFPCLDPDGRSTGRLMMWSSLILLGTSILPVALGWTGAIYLLGALVLGLSFQGCVAIFARGLDRGAARRVVQASIAYLPLLYTLLFVDRI